MASHADDRDPQERRRHARFTVDPMYSSVVVTRGKRREDGHVYDVGLGGIRLEVDRPMPTGAEVEIEVTLPGCTEAIAARGRVVRVFSAVDDPGPRRMVVEFESFREGARAMLERYLDQRWLRPVAPEAPPAPVESSSARRSATFVADELSRSAKSASAA